MHKMRKYIVVCVVFISIVIFSCCSNSEEIVTVHNSSPKHVDKKYVELEKLYSIDVTEISLFGRDTSTNMQRLIVF